MGEGCEEEVVVEGEIISSRIGGYERDVSTEGEGD